MSKHHPSKHPNDVDHLHAAQEAAREAKAEMVKHMHENAEAHEAEGTERDQPQQGQARPQPSASGSAKQSRQGAAFSNPFMPQSFGQNLGAEWPMAGMQQLFQLQMQLFETMMQNWNSLMTQTLGNLSPRENPFLRRRD